MKKVGIKKNTKIPSFFVNTFLHFLPSQSEVNAANRTSETIMKNIGAEKKVQDSKVLKKLSGDEAVQVRWIFPKILKGVTENRH